MKDLNLRLIAEDTVRKRAGIPSLGAFRMLRQRRRELLLDDWDGEIQMVLAGLMDMAQQIEAQRQCKLPPEEE